MNADLVCKSGGIKGVALVGAVAYLEQQGYRWKRIAGSSAGSIIASLLAVGYSAKEVKDIMFSIDYTCFRDKNKVQSLPFIGDMMGILAYKGIYCGDYIEKLLYDKLKLKGKTKFRDVSVNGESKLKIVAADVTKKELLILPDDLVKYSIDPMEFEISKAVRMSCSIPFYFKPVKLKYNKKTSYIVDGGLISNFPIWIFDVDTIPKWPTFGLNLIDSIKEDSLKLKGPISYMLDVVQTSLYTGEDIYFKEKDSIRIINIPTFDINAVNFSITEKEMNDLYQSGYTSAEVFLKNWDFNRYIARYRI